MVYNTGLYQPFIIRDHLITGNPGNTGLPNTANLCYLVDRLSAVRHQLNNSDPRGRLVPTHGLFIDRHAEAAVLQRPSRREGVRPPRHRAQPAASRGRNKFGRWPVPASASRTRRGRRDAGGRGRQSDAAAIISAVVPTRARVACAFHRFLWPRLLRQR